MRRATVARNGRRIAQVSAKLRMMDGCEAPASVEVRIDKIIFRSSNWRPCETDLLRQLEDLLGGSARDHLFDQIVAIGISRAPIVLFELGIFRGAQDVIDADLVGKVGEGTSLALEGTEAG